MRRLVYIFLGVSLLFSSVFFVTSSDLVKSKYRDTSDPMFGKIIFGTSLPFEKEDSYENVGDTFTWGTFDHLEARVYFPRQFGEIVDDLLKEVSDKGLFLHPYLYSDGIDLWIDDFMDGAVGDQLAYGGCKYDLDDRTWDQCLCWLYDKNEPGDIMTVSGKSYPEGITDQVFPDVCLLRPGKYHVQLQYYVQIKGETGGGEWNYSESGGGTWTFNPSEGYINVGIAGGEFTFIVPE